MHATTTVRGVVGREGAGVGGLTSALPSRMSVHSLSQMSHTCCSWTFFVMTDKLKYNGCGGGASVASEADGPERKGEEGRRRERKGEEGRRGE
jgi:hypothetical protein